MRRNLIAGLLLLLSAVATFAQEPAAAALEITRAGAAIQLQQTALSIRLREGAVTPLGAADTVQTNDEGRVLLSTGEALLLLLPQSALTITDYQQTASGARFAAQVNGIALVQVQGAADFALSGTQVTVRGQQGSFGIWTAGAEDEVVAVAAGMFEVEAGGESYSLQAGDALRYRREGVQITQLDAPYNQARVIGVLDGCPGLVETRADAAGVLVRTGPGRGYERRILVATGSSVQMISRTESGIWYRVQYGNGFGWSAAEAVVADCDLPVVPDDSPQESLVRVIEPDERELDLLRAFYGNPLLDPWFYVLRAGE